jgi:type VI secretion system protein ImpM
MNAELEIGWYGKLPSSGDFVSRRIPRSLMGALDTWLARGLEELRLQMPDDWRQHFDKAPLWNCALPARIGAGTSLIGVLIPSRDRVGRAFPLCAGVALPHGAPTRQLLTDVAEWLRHLGHAVVEARDNVLSLEDFDANLRAIELPSPARHGLAATGGSDIFDALGIGPLDAPTIPMPLAQAVPWPELPMIFDAREPTSYWWTGGERGSPVSGFTTDSGLEPSLLMKLLGPQIAGAEQQRGWTG